MSIVALASAIVEEVKDNGKSETAAAFQLVELLRVLDDLASDEHEVLRDLSAVAADRVRKQLDAIKKRRPELFEPNTAFSGFERMLAGDAS